MASNIASYHVFIMERIMIETKKDTDFPTWKKESFIDRAKRCIAVLYINGIITQAERNKAHERLSKSDKVKG